VWFECWTGEGAGWLTGGSRRGGRAPGKSLKRGGGARLQLSASFPDEGAE
jgi:hypothetical protein